MTLRSRIWRVLVVLFILANLLGAGYAAIAGEGIHCAIHAGLLLLTAVIIWRRSARDVARY
jgi:hypothetical protein